ncbi:MAG: DEAD/DEAH box helicase, partial [Pseudomonadota bacterium]
MSGRLEVLFPLFAELETLPGIGPKTATHFAALNVSRPRDLLFVLPQGVIDRRLRPSLLGVSLPATVTVDVEVGRHMPPRQKGRPYRIQVEDRETAFQLVFFNGREDYLTRVLPSGSRRVVSGKTELFDGVAQMVHPDHILAPEDASSVPDFEPVYPLTAGVTQKVMARAVSGALKRRPDLPEWIDPAQCEKAGWPSWDLALDMAHAPETSGDLSPNTPARERLAYDEFMAHQLTLALARAHLRQSHGRSTTGTGARQAKVVAALPYKPTAAQSRALAEIADDMAAPHRMNRLLQGDVGAGKTFVAFMALLIAVEAVGQGVLMAPTEILARQHLQGLQ